MVSSIATKVEEKLSPVITSLGYEVVDVEFTKRSDGASLTIYIANSVGISLDDCEKVHRAIDPILDELNPTGDDPYTLNVSSPGLDRPFIKQRDFERNYGKEVEVKLYAPLKGKKNFEGVLVERNQSTVTVMIGNQETKLENTRVALVRPLVKFE